MIVEGGKYSALKVLDSTMKGYPALRVLMDPMRISKYM